MRWFRSNIKRVSHVALFALAIQFVLSFGHFHGVAADAASVAQSGSAQSGFLVADSLTAKVQQSLSVPQPGSPHDSGGHPGDICAICVVMAMANAALFALPPMALLPQAVEFSYLAAPAEFVSVASVRVAFQPRAPPAS